METATADNRTDNGGGGDGDDDDDDDDERIGRRCRDMAVAAATLVTVCDTIPAVSRRTGRHMLSCGLSAIRRQRRDYVRSVVSLGVGVNNYRECCFICTRARARFRIEMVKEGSVRTNENRLWKNRKKKHLFS